MATYDWVSNIMKLKLAEADLKLKNIAVTEEAVKEAYVKRGGLVIDVVRDVVVESKVEERKVEAPVIRRRVR